VWRFAPKNCLDKYQQGLNESSQKAKQCQCNFTEIQLSEFAFDLQPVATFLFIDSPGNHRLVRMKRLLFQ
jgi:hypothetical protein